MLKRFYFLIILSLLTSSLFFQPAHALDCEVASRESEAGSAGTILEARVVAVYYEDGTPYSPGGEWREDAVLMHVDVARVWRGKASEQDVIRFADPEWGGVPPVGVARIYYLNRWNGQLATGNCIRLVEASEDERAYLEAIYGDGQAVAAGASENHAALLSLLDDSSEPAGTSEDETRESGLQPIAVGPGTDAARENWSQATFPMNLFGLVALLLIGLGFYRMRGRFRRQKSPQKKGTF